MANPYSIHLVEPLSPEVAQRVASETASQLGGTPDKLAQLLTRNSGSRIARASSAAQADRVANILRKAGVVVQVVDPEQTEAASSTQVVAQSKGSSLPTQVQTTGANVPVETSTQPSPPSTPQTNANLSNYDVNAGSSSNSSGGTPIVPDEIIPIDEAPYSPPTQATNPTSLPELFPMNTSSVNAGDSFSAQTDPFASGNQDLFSQEPNPFGQPQKPAVASPSNNPFAPPATDSFAAPTNDPFAAPSSDAFNARVGDAFAAASSKNPFAEPSSNDPFAAPKNDPFAAPSARDPFAAASGKTPNPESAPAFDPFTQNQASGAASDLPAQALKAQNRATRRTSVRAQLLASILFPILLVGIGIVIFLAYQLNIIYREQLRIQAVQATAIIAAAQTSAYRKIPDPEALKTLNEASQNYFKLIPEAELIFVESGNSKLSNMTQLSTQTRNPIDPVSMKEIARNMDGFSQGTGSGFFSVAGTDYVGAITQLYAADGSPLGDIHVAFSTSRIASNELNAIVPLLIALGLITLLAIVAATTLSSRLVRPITAAADQANRISLGDLDRVVDIQSNDEIGDLLGSLERMRVSLKSVIGRLRRDR